MGFGDEETEYNDLDGNAFEGRRSHLAATHHCPPATPPHPRDVKFIIYHSHCEPEELP